MVFTAPSSSKGDYKPFPIIEAGAYPARCYGIVDLGTHDNNFQGVVKKKRSIRFSFEFPTETTVFDEKKGPQPFSVTQTFGFSMFHMGKLRPFIEQWLGKKFTDEEADAFDFEKLIGQTAFINVAHSTGKDDRNYANISTIMPLPKAMECPKQVNASMFYNVTEHNETVFNKLHPKTQEKIMASYEMQERTSIPEAEDNLSKMHMEANRPTVEELPF